MDSSLTALSPVDGRYRAATEGLAVLLSESGLVRERIRVEALWLLQQAESLRGHAALPFSAAVTRRIEQLADDPGETSASMVKAIEKRINHDVKAVEYFVRDEIRFCGAESAPLPVSPAASVFPHVRLLSSRSFRWRFRAPEPGSGTCRSPC